MTANSRLNKDDFLSLKEALKMVANPSEAFEKAPGPALEKSNALEKRQALEKQPAADDGSWNLIKAFLMHLILLDIGSFSTPLSSRT